MIKTAYYTLAVLLLLLYSGQASAQEKKVAPTPPALYNEIARMDSIVFAAFNRQDMDTLSLIHISWAFRVQPLLRQQLL